MKTKIFNTLAMILMLSNFAFAAESQSGRISGIIIDAASNEPVSFATITLINSTDSTLLTGVMSTDNGEFSIEKIPFGEYDIVISYVGYEAEIINNVTINWKNSKIDLGKTEIAEKVNNIDEVVVEAERLRGETKVDRTVFTINDEIKKSSADAYDILQNVPAVTVDFQDNLTLEGKSNIQIYVDGILRSKDYVAQLDPSQIDKVEVMTNPSARYDADVDGVINIVLVKQKRTGVNGNIRADIANPDKAIFNPSGRIEYGNSKFRVYVSDRLHYERFNGHDDLTNTQTLENGDIRKYVRNGEGYNRWSNNNLSYGLDYFINDKTSVNFYGEYSTYAGIYDDFKYKNKLYLNDDLQSSYMTLNNKKDKGSTLYYSAYFKKALAKEGSEIIAEINFYDYSGGVDNSFTDTDPEGNILNSRIENTKNKRNSSEFKLDYVSVIGKLKQEMGVRSTYQWINNEIEATASEQPGFKYNELRQAAYYSLSGSVQKLNWQAGVRGEYSDIEAEDVFTTEYLAFLPNLSLQYGIKENQSAKFSYRRSINRPGINDLNPFETWSDSLHLWYGNPKLDPALFNNFELSYSINFKKNYLAPKLYLNYTNNNIQETSFLNENGVMEFMKQNIGESYEYGTGLTASIQITKWWVFNAQGAAYKQVIYSDHEFNVSDKQEKLGYQFGAMNRFALPKKFNLGVITQYKSPWISYQRTHHRDFLGIVTLDKQLGESAKIEMFYAPLMDRFAYQGVKTESDNMIEDWEGSIDVKNIFAISFIYNFKSGKNINKINRSTDYQKDGGGGSF